jgi:hypothetical protein
MVIVSYIKIKPKVYIFLLCVSAPLREIVARKGAETQRDF